MNNYRNEIELEGSDLDVGESKYVECVACSKKGKLGISCTDVNTYLFHCFSASCVLHRGGIIGSGGRQVPTQPRPKAREHFHDPVIPLDAAGRAHLQGAWGFYDEHFAKSRVKWCQRKQRYALPILSSLGEIKGWVLRSFNQHPKALTYLNKEDDTRLSWYPSDPRTDWVIVTEDIPSAVRASKFVNAVSLLGTSCNYETACELADYTTNIIWCLDNDVTIQGMRLRQEYALLFERSDLIVPRCDLKNMPDEELEGMLKDYGIGEKLTSE